jgi:hypothetical protein
MPSLSLVYSELMSQNYSDAKKANLIKIGLLFFFKEKNFYIKNLSLNEITEYIYRFVRDNISLEDLTSNVILKNISKYDPSDLLIFVEQDLKEWIKSGKGFLKFKDGYVTTESEEEFTNNELIQLEKVIEAISIKNIGKKINYISTINHDEIKYIKSIYEMKSTRIWNRATEKVKFCMCCNDSNLKNLYMVYIYDSQDIDDEESLVDPHNTLILCNEHVDLYLKGYFSFNTEGRIVIFKKHPNLDLRMRIPIQLITTQRLTYLIMKRDFLAKRGNTVHLK